MILNITIFSFIIALMFLSLMFFGGCTRDKETRQTENPTPKTQISAVQQPQRSDKMEVELKKKMAEYNELGEKLVKEHKYDEALAAFEEANKLPVSDERGLKEVPESKLMNAIGKYSNPKDALAWIDANLAKNLDKQEPFIIMDVGSMYMMCENYQKAIEVMENGANLHPDSLSLHFRAISAHILNVENRKLKGEEREKNFQEAKVHLEALKKITGEKHQKYFLAKAYIEIEQDDKDSAIQSFTAALNPSVNAEDDKTAMNIDANYYLALLLIEKGEYEKAGKHLNVAAALYDELDKDSQDRYNPVRVSIIAMREMYCNEIAKPDSFDGILKDRKYLEEVAGVFHEPRSISLSEGVYKFVEAREKGNKKEALRQLKRLNKILVLNATCEPYHKLISPRNISAFHTFRGDIFAGEGDMAQAKSEYQKALEYTPGDKMTLSKMRKI